MPPKKTSGVPALDEPPAWLQAILTRWDGFFTRFDKMFDLVLKMQETQITILSKLSALEERVAAAKQDPCPPNAALYSTLVKFQGDSKLVLAKSCGITWVGINEQIDEPSTHAFDQEALKEIIDSSADDDLIREFSSGQIEVHRHPKVKGKGSRPRIIKIYLRNQELRDRLLRHMRNGRLSLTKQFVHSYARRDYTREELEYDRSLRQKAGEMNKQQGMLKFVRDFAIHELRCPRALPHRSEPSLLYEPSKRSDAVVAAPMVQQDRLVNEPSSLLNSLSP